MAWHWQERFELADVEGACRRQILKIQKPLPYETWLKRKTRVNKDSGNQEVDFVAADNNQDKQDESDAAFRDWLRQKRKLARSARKQQDITATEKIRAEPWCKPPSLHVNPKTKSSTRKAESSMLKSSSASCFHQGHSSVENQQAYAAWLSRIRQEDQIRRAQRCEQLKRIEQQQRDKHKVTWRKKLAVCAYSTLVVDS